MPIIFVFIVSLFGCGVHASQLSLDSLNEESTESAQAEELFMLKRKRHKLRERLYSRVRTPSIAPPTGERRHKMVVLLSQIEYMIEELEKEY